VLTAGFGSRAAVPPVRGRVGGDAKAGLAARWPALSRDPGNRPPPAADPWYLPSTYTRNKKLATYF